MQSQSSVLISNVTNILNDALDVDSPLITELLSTPMLSDANTLYGKFRSDSNIYNYEITGNSVIFERLDSISNREYLEGYYADYPIARYDALGQCKKGGIRCGGVCLSPGKKCRINNKFGQVKQHSKQSYSPLANDNSKKESQSDKKKRIATTIAGATLGTAGLLLGANYLINKEAIDIQGEMDKKEKKKEKKKKNKKG